MLLKLDIYTDETLTEVKRVAEADGLKIPYRTAVYLISSLDTLNIKNDNDLIKLVTGNVELLDKIVKATFGVSENELDCINATQLIGVAKELYKWAINKINELKGNNSKNGQTPASL